MDESQVQTALTVLNKLLPDLTRHAAHDRRG
jgi:hypothetical protein